MNKSTLILKRTRKSDEPPSLSSINDHPVRYVSVDQKTILTNNRKNSTLSTKLIRWFILALCVKLFIIQKLNNFEVVDGSVLMKVCDPREIKTVTNRVCMLYKRTKNSDIRLDRQGNIRVTRSSDEEEMSADKLATECCKKGCPPHIFAVNC